MKNRITELLGIEKPVILGAMIYVDDAELAAAVCNAGGLGLLGLNCAVTEAEPDPEKNAENLRGEIRKLRTLTDKPFAYNYIPPRISSGDSSWSIYDKHAVACKKVLIEEKVPVVVMATSIKDYKVEEEIKDFHAAGMKVLYREGACTLDSCLAARAAGADAIIVTGCEAGGHNSTYNMSLITILPQITDAITDIPIIASGGIVGTKGAAAAKVMGAEGAYCGSAFLVAKEGRIHPNFKKAIIGAKGEDIIVWNASTLRMSTTPNYVGRICLALDRGGASPMEIGSQYAGTFNKSMLEGDVERGCVAVSASVGAIKEERPAAEIVNDIAKGFE